MTEVTIKTEAPKELGLGGAYEGAERTSQAIGLWAPPLRSADADNNPDKDLLDARSRDISRNDGNAGAGVQAHRDGIVGNQYRLNVRPNWKVLGLSEDWAVEFQEEAEAKFTLFAESPSNWLDASRSNTFTELVRLAVGVFSMGGEVLATAEWIDRPGRPYRTAIQMIDTDRLSNPRGQMDDKKFRKGVERDFRGAPIAYHIRRAHPGDFHSPDMQRWKRIPVKKPWGRTQVIHIVEQHRIDQTRGISDMVSVLREMKMLSKYSDVALQNAVVNATYAAAIESELPPEAAFESLGMGDAQGWAEQHLAAIAEYTGGSRNLHIDGVKIPHLYPGTKLKMMNAGTPGGIGTAFEESLHRRIAAGFGLSYEQYTRDYTKTNYSSAKASIGETLKFLMGRKAVVADRFASEIYALWLEEALNRGDLTLPNGAPNFYEGLNKEAYAACSWIGASRGQVEELKETEAALLRIAGRLSTYEKECGRLGSDYREVFAQAAREDKLMADLGIEDSGSAASSKTNSLPTKNPDKVQAEPKRPDNDE